MTVLATNSAACSYVSPCYSMAVLATNSAACSCVSPCVCVGPYCGQTLSHKYCTRVGVFLCGSFCVGSGSTCSGRRDHTHGIGIPQRASYLEKKENNHNVLFTLIYLRSIAKQVIPTYNTGNHSWLLIPDEIYLIFNEVWEKREARPIFICLALS